jgi:calcium-dependent protein kinase
MDDNVTSKNEEEQIKKFFNEIDDSGDGVLSKEEIKKGCYLMEMHLTDKEIEVIFKVYDRDKSGTLDFNEFLEALTDRKKNKKQAKMKCESY